MAGSVAPKFITTNHLSIHLLTRAASVLLSPWPITITSIHCSVIVLQGSRSLGWVLIRNPPSARYRRDLFSSFRPPTFRHVMGQSYDYSIRSVRLRVLRDIFRGFAVPVGAVFLALRLVGIRLGYFSGALVFPVAALSGSYLLSVYRNYVDSREASRLGAIPVPT